MTWDPLLFRGTAQHYRRGRLPYAAGLGEAIRGTLDLKPQARAVDVGCGPGTVTVLLAPFCADVVGIDPDPDMMVEARAHVREKGLTNVHFVRAAAEDLPLGVGTVDVATFAASFHWMRREQVARTVRDMLTPGGAVVMVDTDRTPVTLPDGAAPSPPRDEITALVTCYLGEGRRAGSRTIASTPGDEESVFATAGYRRGPIVDVPSSQVLTRTVDDIVSSVLSMSFSAPHLFGDRLEAFVADLRFLLESHARNGQFAEPVPPARLRVFVPSRG